MSIPPGAEGGYLLTPFRASLLVTLVIVLMAVSFVAGLLWGAAFFEIIRRLRLSVRPPWSASARIPTLSRKRRIVSLAQPAKSLPLARWCCESLGMRATRPGACASRANDSPNLCHAAPECRAQSIRGACPQPRPFPLTCLRVAEGECMKSTAEEHPIMWQTKPIASRLPGGFLAFRTVVLGLLLLAVSLAAPKRGLADKALPDVVDEFRRALKLEAGNKEGDVLKYYDTKSTRKQVQYAVEFREKNLQAIAGRMTSLGELSQALLLQEWILSSPAEPPGLDNKIRDAMVKQFADGLRRALANSNPAVVAATCAVIEDVSTNARLQEPKQLDLAAGNRPGAGPDQTDRQQQCWGSRRGGASPGRVKGLARDVAPVLKKLLASGNEVVVRRAAAQAFLDQIQYLVTQVTMPPRENTRDSPLLREPRLREECRDFSIRALDAFTTLPCAGLADPEDPIRLLCTNTCGQIASGLATAAVARK